MTSISKGLDLLNSHKQRSAWLTLGEASEFLGIHPTTLREWVDDRRLASFRTPGGHRRFNLRDLQVFLQQRKSIPEISAIALAERNPLASVRRQLDESSVTRQRWYRQLSDEQRAKQREAGQRMLGLLIQYASRREDVNHFLEEGCKLSREHGRALAREGLSVCDVARAFLFIRRAILNATHQPQDYGAPYDAEGLRLYQRINQFMDEMLLSTLDAYESQKQCVKPVRPLPLKSPRKRRVR